MNTHGEDVVRKRERECTLGLGLVHTLDSTDLLVTYDQVR